GGAPANAEERGGIARGGGGRSRQACPGRPRWSASMNHRQRLAVGVAPLLLRVALAITFIWAGLGKVAATMPVSGQAAATLANMGVSIPNAPVLPTPTAGLDGPPDGEPMPADGFRNEPPAGGGGAAARAKPR